MSLQTNVNLTFLLEGKKKKKRKHSLLPQLIENVSERVLVFFFFYLGKTEMV